MRLSINVTSYPDSAHMGGYLGELGEAADAAGVDTMWLADHLVQAQPGHDVDEPMLEAFATLGYLARCTERVRLGTMVAPATVRAPALLVKTVSTLDVLSGGRMWLGIGAGYQLDEARAMGLDVPEDVDERFARLEQTLQVARRMFAGDTSAFLGTDYRLERPSNNPRPVGRVPILVGGAGERRTLRLVARDADACNVFDIPDDGATVRRKMSVLDRHCAEFGRDPATIDRSISTFWATDASPADVAARCRTLSTLGITDIVLLRNEPWRAEHIDQLRAVSDELAGIGTPEKV